MGILLLFESGLPASNLWTRLSTDFALAYFTITLSLNVILTLLIVVRLLIHRRRVRKHLGPEHATHYTSIASMLIESSALYSLFSLLFLVSFAVRSFAQNLFLPVLAEIQVSAAFAVFGSSFLAYICPEMISPLLIVIRVARGRGWSTNTAASAFTPTDIQFDHPSGTSLKTTDIGQLQESSDTVSAGFDGQASSSVFGSGIVRDGHKEKEVVF